MYLELRIWRLRWKFSFEFLDRECEDEPTDETSIPIGFH